MMNEFVLVCFSMCLILTCDEHRVTHKIRNKPPELSCCLVTCQLVHVFHYLINQCFTLCARALGFDARMANDWTDHVWTEVRLAIIIRFFHWLPYLISMCFLRPRVLRFVFSSLFILTRFGPSTSIAGCTAMPARMPSMRRCCTKAAGARN